MRTYSTITAAMVIRAPRKRRYVAVLVATTAFAFAPAARAQDPSLVDEKAQADAAMRGQRPADALPIYEALYARTHQPALLYNIAQAHFTLAHFAAAYRNYTQFRAAAAPDLLERVPQIERLIADVRARITELRVASNVPVAEVRVDTRPVGTTPFAEKVFVDAGTAVVEVTAPGHLPWSRTVELLKGGVLSLEPKLLPDTGASLDVSTERGETAAIEIDGVAQGGVPGSYTLAAGQHHVRVFRDGYTPWTSLVSLDVREHRRLVVPLTRDVPVVQSWWFWTIVGAVVVGGATTAFVLTRERSADTGTLNPGQIHAAALRF